MVTPVRNEAWILGRFLAVTRQFADLIIVADQGSTDGSREIAAREPKVCLIENSGKTYQEAERQALLLAAARREVPGRRVLLALDADEILAADSLRSNDWEKLRTAEAGTVLYFEKPDLVGGVDRCIRYRDNFWPMGYVDDGREHFGAQLHSVRIPCPEGAPAVRLQGIRFLHYGLTRLNAQAAKLRFYSALENVHAIHHLVRRRLSYGQKRYFQKIHREAMDTSDPEWFKGWEDMGIEMRLNSDTGFQWMNYEVLRFFNRYGEGRFWWDDLWAFDWEACRQEGIQQGESGFPDREIQGPAWIVRRGGDLLESGAALVRRALQRDD